MEDHSASSACFHSNDTLADQLPDSTADGRARKQALAALARTVWDGTGVVNYQSAGRVLILDELGQGPGRPRALDAAGQLVADGCTCTVLLDGLEADSRDQVSRKLSTKTITVVAGRLAKLHGHLGHYSAWLDGKREDVDLAALGPAKSEFFDLVLDLGATPYLQREVPPPGYYATGNDEQALQQALQAIPSKTGDFSKPVYIKYRSNICAHGGDNVSGCSRCLDVCPAEAISDKGSRVEVNTSLCQGCGSCIINCPTAALSYTYPPVQQWLVLLREMLKTYAAAGGTRPAVLLYDECGAGNLQAVAADLPEHVIPVEVHGIGALGADAWLALLAYGAGAVLVLAGDGTPGRVVSTLQSQLDVVQAILQGMGYRVESLRLMDADGLKTLADDLAAGQLGVETPAAGFDPFEKAITVRMAVDHLYRHAPQKPEYVDLPPGAAFGEIQVDKAGCTLCMSCVTACPAKALRHDAANLRLELTETSCVQCGACDSICPEDAITLLPRYAYDESVAGKPRLLNEDEPFRCISCGKPFAGRRMLDKVVEKLSGNNTWNVSRDSVPEWLQKCGDCRIK